ncbi:KAP P-loop domain [Branchiostoma belcheri]|nr:KAP P-loop domain [Branchiostoma belcheri]
MAASQPEPWGGKIIRYKKLPSAEGEDAGNESSSSDEGLGTRIAKFAGLNGGPGERDYDGTGTDGEREWPAEDPGSVLVDTWERGAVPKSPDEWSSARSSLAWEEEDQPVVYERPPAAGHLPAPPVHRKVYNKPVEMLEASSSSSSSLAAPYHGPAYVGSNRAGGPAEHTAPYHGTERVGPNWAGGPTRPVRNGLPEERDGARLTNGDCSPLLSSNHVRSSRERVSLEMPDEVVISSQPKDGAGPEIPEEVCITQRPGDHDKVAIPWERDGADYKVPGARDRPKGLRTKEETLPSIGSTEEREARLSTGSTEEREASPSTGSPRERVASTPTSISTVIISPEAPPSGSRPSVRPLRWDPHLPRAVQGGDPARDPPGNLPDPAGDPLGYDVYARSIAEIVTDERTEMPLTVGIYGGWGMGKTFLLALMKVAVDNIMSKKGKEYEAMVKGEKDGVEENKSRGQKTRFPTVLCSVLLFLFVTCLCATIACGILFDRVWVVFLVGTVSPPQIQMGQLLQVVAFVLLVGTAVYGFRRRLLDCCAAKIPLLQKSNPMYWMVGIYLEWVDPPNMSAETGKPENKRYEVIWVNFNAWEFSGCKVLWAGIVTTLCDAVESKVGSKPARFFRVIQLNGGGKKALFRRAWFKLLLSAVGVVILVVIVLVLLLSGGAAEIDKFMQGPQIKGIIGSITGFLGLGIVVHLRKGLDLVKNMAKSQKEKLDARMKKPDFAEQLGFMSEVKSEVQTVTSLLRFLEHVMRIQYRVIIVVDDLDCCPGDRVIGVLESMSILLSDEESNIISIVAMDPKIVVNCLESRLTDTITNNSSGYEYLRRIVHFPVCLPEPSVEERRKLFYKIVEGKDGILVRRYVSVKTGRISFKAGTKAKQAYQADSQGRTSAKGRPSLWTALPDAQYDDLENQDGGRQDISNQDGGAQDETDEAEETLRRAVRTQVSTYGLLNNFRLDDVKEEYEDYLGDVIQALDDDDDDAENDIMPYIHGNALHITSLYHVLRMTVKVLRHRQLLQCVTPRQVALWVVLVEQWPYRTSWVLQFVEDCQQKDRIKQRCLQETGKDEINTINNDTKLADVFQKLKPEMNVDDFRRLNNLDGDPEMFELLLGESKFTVKDMSNLLPCTINLDYSIQRRIATIRGLSLE